MATTGRDSNAGTAQAPFATVQHGLDVAQAGDTVVVHGGRYPELAVFPRSGQAGRPIRLVAACGEQPVLDGAGLGRGIGAAALVRIEGRSHVTVEGLELKGLTAQGGNFPAGIWVRGSCSDVLIRGNEVHHISGAQGGAAGGAHGIAVYGTETTATTDVRLEGNHVHHLTLGPSEAVVVNGNVRGFRVTDNHVHDTDNIAFDFIGFEGDVCPRCSQVEGVSADVERAREGVISGNLAHDVTSANNPAYSGELASSCFYVDGASDLVIERNVGHGCDLGIELASEHHGHATARITVRNNFLWGNRVTGIASGGYDDGTGPGGGSAEDCVVVHNTVVDSSRGGWADTGVLLQNRNVNVTYANNVIVASRGFDAVNIAGSLNRNVQLHHNLVFGGGYQNATPGAGSLTADPKLVDGGLGNFHLLPNSPCIGAGAALSDAQRGLLDLDGDPRGTDLGADQR